MLLFHHSFYEFFHTPPAIGSNYLYLNKLIAKMLHIFISAETYSFEGF